MNSPEIADDLLPEQCDECESTGYNCSLHKAWAAADDDQEESEATTADTWQPNQPLPGNQKWGYASRSRYRAMAGPVVEHVVVDSYAPVEGAYGQLLCSGGSGIVGTGGGRLCRECVALVRDQLSDG